MGLDVSSCMRKIEGCLYVGPSDQATLERMIADGKTPQKIVKRATIALIETYWADSGLLIYVLLESPLLLEVADKGNGLVGRLGGNRGDVHASCGARHFTDDGVNATFLVDA